MIKNKWIAGILAGILSIVVLGAAMYLLDGVFHYRPKGNRIMYIFALGTIFAFFGLFSLIHKSPPEDENQNNDDPYAGGDLPPRHS